MPPDLAFALILLAKMTITAGFVLAATMTAERAGPLIGGLVATLPIGAGPVYVFLALDHDAQFLAESAVNSLAINAANAIFALVYALLAQKRTLAVSLPGAFLVWLVLALAIHAHAWNFAEAAAVNAVVLAVCLWLARPLRHVPIPRVKARWYELAMRAVMVAVLVGITVSFSFTIGASGTGILAVFPIVLMSIMIILHRRVGGKPTAAVMANAILGLIGFGLACAALHFAAAFGSVVGLALGLAVSIAWSLLMYGARRCGIPV
jgi:hypothetical protein